MTGLMTLLMPAVKRSLHPKTREGDVHSVVPSFQVLLGFPQSLQPGGRTFVPHLGVFLPEGPAVTFEEL